MNIQYNVGMQSFIHEIKYELKHKIADFFHWHKLTRVLSSTRVLLTNLLRRLCPCLDLSERQIEPVLKKSEWSKQVLKETLSNRNKRLDSCYIPNLTPTINYLDAVRRHGGAHHNDVRIAAEELAPSTAEMLNSNYKHVIAGHSKVAYEEAIVLQEVLMFEGAHAIPSYHPELDTLVRPPCSEAGDTDLKGLLINSSTEQVGIQFLRMIKFGSPEVAYDFLEKICHGQSGTPTFYDDVAYIMMQCHIEGYDIKPIVESVLIGGRRGCFNANQYSRQLISFEAIFGLLNEGEGAYHTTATADGTDVHQAMMKCLNIRKVDGQIPLSAFSSSDGLRCNVELHRQQIADELLELIDLILNRTDVSEDEIKMKLRVFFGRFPNFDAFQKTHSPLFRQLWTLFRERPIGWVKMRDLVEQYMSQDKDKGKSGVDIEISWFGRKVSFSLKGILGRFIKKIVKIDLDPAPAPVLALAPAPAPAPAPAQEDQSQDSEGQDRAVKLSLKKINITEEGQAIIDKAEQLAQPEDVVITRANKTPLRGAELVRPEGEELLCEICCEQYCSDQDIIFKTTCCDNGILVCLNCISASIEEDSNKNNHFENWLERGQMIRCPACENLPIQLGAYEQRLSEAAQGILTSYHQRQIANLHSNYSNGVPVFCSDDHCKKAYLINKHYSHFQCNNVESHADKCVKLHHVICGALWTNDHCCPLSRERKIGEEIEATLHIIHHTDTIKKCPSVLKGVVCNTIIEKNEGCMVMTCPKCITEFCWMCAQPMKGHNSGEEYDCEKSDIAIKDKVNRLKQLDHELTDLLEKYETITGKPWKNTEEKFRYIRYN